MLLMLLASAPKPSTALCTTPNACRLVGLSLLTFLFSFVQLVFLVTMSIVLGCTCCCSKEPPKCCCGGSFAFLVVLAVLATLVAVLQAIWSGYAADTINVNNRMDDLWPWLAWNILLAVADGAVAAVAAGWYAALSKKDPSIKMRVESFARVPPENAL